MVRVNRRKAEVLFAASWALGGCNLVSGLDEVNVIQGEGGAAATTSTGATTAPGGSGGGEVTGSGGAGGATGMGGAGGTASTTNTGEGGGGVASTTTTSGVTSTGTTTTTGTTTSTTTTTETTTSTTTETTTSTTTTGEGGGSPVAECGNGTVVSPEQCDDGNGASGDGCSDTCLVEVPYQCTVTGPSVCTKQETFCSDGVDNDEDGAADFSDADCMLPGYAPAAPCQSVLVLRSVNVPVDIPDNGYGKRTSAIFVPSGITVAHTALLLDIAHPHVADLQVTLLPPFGPPRNVTSGNGGSGADYQGTLFDSDCTLPVNVGTAPFDDCFKPESFLPGSGQQAGGAWLLELDDDASGQVGTLQGWALVLCEP